MKLEFYKLGVWNDAMLSVILGGTLDGKNFGVIFSGKALSELFRVPREPIPIEDAFWDNEQFMEDIARDVIEAGRLEYDNTVMLFKEDLLPYFEKRAATAPA